MKIMIVSDIHGSAYYCKEMLAAFEREKADRMLILGDVLYHGPRNDLPREYAPKEVITLLNEMKEKIFCVRGNCDTEVDQMVLDFPILAEYSLIPAGKRMIFVTHGHKFNKSNMPSLQKGDILLHGHTHIPAWEECEDEILYLNPGSVSIPKNESAHGYMTLEENEFCWKEMDGTVYHRLKI